MCEATLDLGLHYIKIKKLEIPQTSKQIFEVLEKNGVIDKKTSVNIKKIIKVKNIAISDNQNLDIDILQEIVEKNLYEFIIKLATYNCTVLEFSEFKLIEHQEFKSSLN